jgi:hypothetical protein
MSTRQAPGEQQSSLSGAMNFIPAAKKPAQKKSSRKQAAFAPMQVNNTAPFGTNPIGKTFSSASLDQSALASTIAAPPSPRLSLSGAPSPFGASDMPRLSEALQSSPMVTQTGVPSNFVIVPEAIPVPVASNTTLLEMQPIQTLQQAPQQNFVYQEPTPLTAPAAASEIQNFQQIQPQQSQQFSQPAQLTPRSMLLSQQASSQLASQQQFSQPQLQQFTQQQQPQQYAQQQFSQQVQPQQLQSQSQPQPQQQFQQIRIPSMPIPATVSPAAALIPSSLQVSPGTAQQLLQQISPTGQVQSQGSPRPMFVQMGSQSSPRLSVVMPTPGQWTPRAGQVTQSLTRPEVINTVPQQVALSTVQQSAPIQVPTPITGLSSSDINSYQDLINQVSIEKELMMAGFVPLEKILIQNNSSNTLVGKFVKVLAKNGQTAFVMIDQNGYVSTQERDVPMIVSAQASSIPYSIKMGAVNCAGLDVCGVAFDCSDSVCVLLRQDDSVPHETNFIYPPEVSGGRLSGTQASQGSYATDGKKEIATTPFDASALIAYPVVRLSEVRVAPAIVLENIDMVTKRIRNIAWKTATEDLDMMLKATDQLRNTIVHFNEVRSVAAKNLFDSMDEAERVYHLLSNPVPTDEGRQKFQLIQFNLRRRNELFVLLTRLTELVALHRPVIEDVNQRVENATQHIEARFSRISGIIYPNEN